jgi:hypothetical protein
VVVRLCIERSLAMLVGLLGILLRARKRRWVPCLKNQSTQPPIASRAELKSQGDGQQTFSAVNPKDKNFLDRLLARSSNFWG